MSWPGSPSEGSERSRLCSTVRWPGWAVSSRPRPTLTVVMTNLPPDPTSPEHAELAGRLRAVGQTPVDPAVASAHLTAIAAVPTGRTARPVRHRFVRSKVAAAFAAGLLLGGTSLASA